MKKNGFTLIELLVVVSIMGVLGFVFTDILTQSLRAQNKVKALNQVKQNGQVVLERMANEVRQAEQVICLGTRNGNDTLVTTKKGTYYRFRIYPPVGNTANGYIALDHWDDAAISADPCNEDQLEMNKEIITDQDIRSGVSIGYDTEEIGFANKAFVLDPQAGYTDAVTIRFRATAGVGSGSTYESTVEDGGVLFTTTSLVRSYK